MKVTLKNGRTINVGIWHLNETESVKDVLSNGRTNSTRHVLPQEVRRVTKCVLKEGEDVLSSARSICHVSDHFVKTKGTIHALKRAMDTANLSREEKKEIFKAVFRKHKTPNGKIELTPEQMKLVNDTPNSCLRKLFTQNK